jgi:hypothetical protein
MNSAFLSRRAWHKASPYVFLASGFTPQSLRGTRLRDPRIIVGRKRSVVSTDSSIRSNPIHGNDGAFPSCHSLALLTFTSRRRHSVRSTASLAEGAYGMIGNTLGKIPTNTVATTSAPSTTRSQLQSDPAVAVASSFESEKYTVRTHPK